MDYKTYILTGLIIIAGATAVITNAQVAKIDTSTLANHETNAELVLTKNYDCSKFRDNDICELTKEIKTLNDNIEQLISITYYKK